MFTSINSLVELDYYDKYKELTDEELILIIKEGDIHAEEYLFLKYYYLMKLIVGSFFILGGDKEDLLQEAMIGLYKAIKDYNCEKNSSFRTFAELCIKRQIITAVRQASRQKHNPLNNYISINTRSYENSEDLIFLEKYKSSKIIDPEKLIVGKEQAELIEDIIDKVLSNFEKEVLEHYLEGKTYSEISILMNKNEKAIDNALQRVKKKILKYV